MKNLTKFVAIATVAVMAVGAFAQQGQGQGGQRQGGGFGGGRQGGGGFGGGQFRRMGGVMSPSMLVFRNDVQEDLKLTSEQKDKLQDFQDKQREEMRARFQGGGQRPTQEEMQASMKKGQEDTKAAVNGILNDEQKTRLQQIYIQLQGKRAVTDADVAKAVGITADQKTKLNVLVEKQQAANRDLFMNRDLSMEDRMARAENNNKVLDAEIDKILTDAQRTKLKELEGPKFTPDQD